MLGESGNTQQSRTVGFDGRGFDGRGFDGRGFDGRGFKGAGTQQSIGVGHVLGMSGLYSESKMEGGSGTRTHNNNRHSRKLVGLVVVRLKEILATGEKE